MAELKLRFHYEGGIAESGRLELYDAAIALRGIARTSSIITHAYLNGAIRTHGDGAEGAKFYIDTPKRGSFVYEAIVWTAEAINSGLFYDFFKYGLNETVGRNGDNGNSKALNTRIEPTIGELPMVLESALQEMHKPIREDDAVKLVVTKPRGEELAVFDSETGIYLLPSTVPAPHVISGNVTKYNSLTGWGKFYDLVERRTISFNIDLSSSEREKSLITWSLHENNMKRTGLLYFGANAVVSPTSRVKRYIVHHVSDKSLT